MAITDIEGVRVGQWTDLEARTGCTVVLLPDEGAVAAVDVRGPAPATRETDLLRPGRLVERAHAICLCGGSAFGLAAADGVMRFLRERGRGFEAPPVAVPIVPAAAIFDLGVGAPEAPGAREGYAACLEAERSGAEVAEGRVGAGTGATVGKLLGPEHASPGGVGTASVRLPGGAVVAALAVVNAVGDVHGRDGAILAGARTQDGGFAGAHRLLLERAEPVRPPAANTTIAVLATDARLDRAGCLRLAEQGHDGLALAVRPAHTLYDGDTVFAVSTERVDASPVALGAAAVEAMWRAIERAVAP
jgi:L-aminopeptidase/D-esterase-like protein